MKPIKMKGYRVSCDYSRLKELLDKDYYVIILWIHDTTKNIFSDIARRVPHINGGVDGNWYSIGCWGYFPTINKNSFEDFCERIGFTFIDPDTE